MQLSNRICDCISIGFRPIGIIRCRCPLNQSKAAAIVYGQVLTPDEITGLVDNLFACETPNYTPDGSVVISTIKDDDINKLFK